jgi:hypothetical protein
MNRIMFQRILDGATSLAVLAVCVLILVQAVRSKERTLAPQPDASAASARLAPGDQLQPIAGVDLTKSQRTLVMAIQSSCHFCTESMTFYRELSRQKGASTRLVVVAPDDPAAAKQYVASHGFSPDAIATSDLPAMNVAGTPTLLLVNPSGVIERVWMGKLTPAREKEVMAEVAR